MKKYILVTGGELRNKGAQAMSFITVDEMAKRYPDCEVVLFSGMDYKRPEDEKSNYKFKILPFPGFGESLSLMTGLLKGRYLKRENGKAFAEYKNIFENAVLLLDISGFALGSKWPDHTNKGYIRRIRLAKHFKIPVYLMPQSFGPFDFKGKNSKKIAKFLNKTLPYPKLIMARENEGAEFLKQKFCLKNVIKTPDLVLQNRELELRNIYREIPLGKEINIPERSVAIIPNWKNNVFGNEGKILELYSSIIELLVSKDYNVRLIYHALEDLKICNQIKDTCFSDCEKVEVITEELSCIDFDEIVEEFDFIIGSRFHSIVHAYKKAVPAVVLGWAVKYQELTRSLQQEQYCFSVEKDNLYGEILNKISEMCDNFRAESEIISAGIAEIQKENVYDFIDIKLI